MEYVEVTTQDQLDKLKPGDIAVVRSGHFTARENSTVTAWGNSTVTARGNSTVTARGNSTVTARGNSTVTAWGNSTVTAWGNSTVTARGNSTVTAWGNSTVTAWGNSTVTAWGNSTVTAWGNSTVTAWGNSTVTASAYVAIHRIGTSPKTRGGVLIQAPDLEKCSGEEWAAFYGLSPTRAGYVTVYAAVDDLFFKGHAYTPTRYAPGDKPVAADWDPGRWCGGGLHFGPTPGHAQRYNASATRFAACKVRAADMVPLGDKIKVRTCLVLCEVNVDGGAL
jgi:hypothetical protein